MRRVLFATTHGYMPERIGGSEISTDVQCRLLAARGFDCAVLAGIEGRGLSGLSIRLRRKLNGALGFLVDRLGGYPVYRHWHPWKVAQDVVDHFRPEVVVIQAGKQVPLAGAFLGTGVRTVFYFHDVLFDTHGARLENVDGMLFLSVSEFVAERVRDEFGISSAIVPPVVLPEDFAVTPRGETVVFINPHPMKGVDIALALAERRPDIPFDFVECWPLPREQRRAVRARVRALPNVRWHRPVSDMRTIYGRARLVLVPSQVDDAWPRVVAEAHISAIPVLGSARGGLPNSVGPGGILIASDADISAWAQALARIWDDAEEHERLSQAARAHARRSEIQPERIIDTFIDAIL